MDFNTKIVTYKELLDRSPIEKDQYGLASFQYEARRRAFLSNPAGFENEDPYMYLVCDDDIPIGRVMLFRTRFKAGDTVQIAYSASAFDVEESYRKEGVGGLIFWETHRMKGRNPLLAAAISDEAIPLSVRLKYDVLTFPKLMQLRDSTAVFRSKGLSGPLLRVISSLTNILLNIFYYLSISILTKPKGYSVQKMSIVPKWVDNIIMQDEHKYAEVHDSIWLQWCLDNKFTEDKRDGQSFYGVFKNKQPVAFFMTKERYRNDAGGLKDIVLGTIVEWGIAKDCKLSEIDIQYMAIKSFSKLVSIIQTITSDDVVIKKLRRMGFAHHGDFRITFNDKSKLVKDASNKALWRVRYGYVDSILF